MKYRIIKIHEKYKIQIKQWWWWNDLCFIPFNKENLYLVGFDVYIKYFDTIENAEKGLKDYIAQSKEIIIKESKI